MGFKALFFFSPTNLYYILLKLEHSNVIVFFNIVDIAFLIIADISFDSILWTITPLTTLFQLIILIPSLAVTVRRFHDIGRSGWWVFIVLVPCVGLVLYLVWLIQDGEPHDNMYGAVPTNLI